ncbi:type IV toxin-antitoxin system AbiEi family antitoxin [Phycisphaera mikurensis]|uniref:Transcriptional regulator AbiEi antitoxin N-terminal domain-containing protein n=1 Tax=Phycisphaera mikurensis (strain NBRC 102666 / KCTC 22515 / FYK2301M01) TaxID=1142394 RepID=I0IJC6_PHYMF|nr:type IV toxin-antitoxin system AbiEi family antitoxin [Phycisphaera mikurensis]MBB6443194.1 hypothetical protein [Phycisphaera mikurensis]BAM05364.1 hypothetical protein PSMK_p00020 [Phycisphaera mikurensis NBRC 102666]
MATREATHLQLLQQAGARGEPLAASHLRSLGISADLQQHYARSGWLERVDRGLFVRPGQEVRWPGVVQVLQRQLHLPVHIGSVAALMLRGRTHTLTLGEGAAGGVTLFGPPGVGVPAWLGRLHAAASLEVVRSSSLPAGGTDADAAGVETLAVEGFDLAVSSAERAILEAVLRFPEAVDAETLRHLIEGLVDLRPRRLAELLRACRLQRVVRVFLVLAERARHPWFRHLDLTGLGPGPGKVQVAGGGVYVPAQRVSVPAKLLGEDQP